MKKGSIIQAIFCVLLCSWYLMSVVGFDIHTDHHDSRTYVVSLLSNTSCESIHPGDECACEHHHHHHDCGEEGINCNHDDCDDSADFLDVTGTDTADLTALAPAAAFCYVAVPAPAEPTSIFAPAASAFRAPPRVLLNNLCVLRV